jgi:hypothetical protein
MHIARTPTHAEELARSLMLGQAGPTDPRSEIAKHAHGRFWRFLLQKSFLSHRSQIFRAVGAAIEY